MKRENTKILIIEDNPSSVDLYQKIFKIAGRTEFAITWSDNLVKALEYEKNNIFDLILLDLNLPDSRGFDTFTKVKEQAHDTPMIILTGSEDETLAIRTVSKGAQDYITKNQLECNMFLRAIDYTLERSLIQKKLQNSKNDLEVKVNERTSELQVEKKKLQRILIETIDAFAFALEKRDPYTAGHQRRVAQLSSAIAELVGLSEEQIKGLYLASLVHDTGKISVPIDILVKPAWLNKHEMNLVRLHPETGYVILKDIEFSWPIAKIVFQHHENINGSGYPQGLSGDVILLEAKILRVSDTFEAMISHRPYRPAIGIDGALKELSENRGIFYEPVAVDACVELFTKKNFKLK
ncbi:MAG: response regulator [bacterium]|nr:response regulator [bacterium]